VEYRRQENLNYIQPQLLKRFKQLSLQFKATGYTDELTNVELFERMQALRRLAEFHLQCLFTRRLNEIGGNEYTCSLCWKTSWSRTSKG
jgi:hypothetical protein